MERHGAQRRQCGPLAAGDNVQLWRRPGGELRRGRGARRTAPAGPGTRRHVRAHGPHQGPSRAGQRARGPSRRPAARADRRRAPRRRRGHEVRVDIGRVAGPEQHLRADATVVVGDQQSVIARSRSVRTRWRACAERAVADAQRAPSAGTRAAGVTGGLRSRWHRGEYANATGGCRPTAARQGATACGPPTPVGRDRRGGKHREGPENSPCDTRAAGAGGPSVDTSKRGHASLLTGRFDLGFERARPAWRVLGGGARA